MATIGKTLIGSTVSKYNIAKNAAGVGSNPSLATDYTSNEVFQFPSDMNTDANPFYMQFNFSQYVRPSILVPPTPSPIGSVILPIPSQNLADNITLNYQPDKNAPMVGAFLNGVAEQYNKKNSLGQAITSTTGAVAGGAAAQGAAAGLSVIGKAVGGDTGPNAILQIGGYAVNPWMTVLFQSPNYKQYALSWMFVPENAQDSLNLRYILNKFRYHSLPTANQGISLGSVAGKEANFGKNILLGYPDMVKPVLYPQGYQFDFKWAVITGIQIDYVPGDTPAFFAGTKAPVAIRLSLTLLEIEYWLKDDIVASTYSS